MAVFASMLTAAFLSLMLAAAEPDVPRRARPVEGPTGWIGPDDYPEGARRRGAEGQVTVELRISERGLPLSCRVRRSSGDSDLDEATCKLVMRRGRFHPALDPAGRPRSDTHRMRVSWRLADPDPMPFEPRLTVARFEVRSGRVTRCEQAVNGSVVEATAAECEEVMGESFTRQAAEAGADATITTVEVFVPEGMSAPAVPSLEDAYMGLAWEAELVFDSDGLLIECRPLPRPRWAARLADVGAECGSMLEGGPRIPPAGEGAPPRRGRFGYAIAVTFGTRL